MFNEQPSGCSIKLVILMNEGLIQSALHGGIFIFFSLSITASPQNNLNFLSKAVAVCCGDCFSSTSTNGLFGHRLGDRGHTLPLVG